MALKQNKIPPSSSLKRGIPQKTAAQTSNAHCEGFSPFIHASRNGYEWADLYDIERLFACVKTCLNYEGFHENGFHLMTITPRPLLEMRTKENQHIYSLAWKDCTAVEHFLRYIPDAIEEKVKNDSFVVVIKDITDISGCSKMCAYLVEKTCQRLQRRFKLRLKKICIFRPSGLLACDISVRKQLKLPFASYDVENKLVLANQFSLGKLAKATGFPGRLIPERECGSGFDFVD